MKLTNKIKTSSIGSATAKSVVGISSPYHKASNRCFFYASFFMPTIYDRLIGGIEKCAGLCGSLLTPFSLSPLVSSFCDRFLTITKETTNV